MDTETTAKGSGNKFAIPASIVISGLIIAGAIIYAQRVSGPTTASVRETLGEGQTGNVNAADNIRPITNKDHVRGKPDAPIAIVEFSDTECPFCKRFHETMQQAVREYGDRIVWVYRHFPLDQLHSKARKEAEATECANELGGNEKFWAYVDRLFEVTPSNDGLDPAELSRIAEFVGLDRAQFQTCLMSGRFAKYVEDDYQDAVNSGGTGTPFNVVIASDGTKTPLIGAQPYSVIREAIERALNAR